MEKIEYSESEDKSRSEPWVNKNVCEKRRYIKAKLDCDQGYKTPDKNPGAFSRPSFQEKEDDRSHGKKQQGKQRKVHRGEAEGGKKRRNQQENCRAVKQTDNEKYCHGLFVSAQVNPDKTYQGYFSPSLASTNVSRKRVE